MNVKQAKLPMHTKRASLELSGSKGKNNNNRTVVNNQTATIGQKYILKPSLDTKRRTISAGFCFMIPKLNLCISRDNICSTT